MRPGSDAPGVPGPAQGDRATAMALVSAILMALMHRTRTGEGSWVGTSLLGNGLWSCGVIAQAALFERPLLPRAELRARLGRPPVSAAPPSPSEAPAVPRASTGRPSWLA